MRGVGRNRRWVVGIGALAVSLAWTPSASWAKQEVLVSDDSPIAVTISSYQLTLIKMPATVVPNGIMTVSPALEVRANGPNVAIDPKGSTAPADLVVMTETQSYLFQLQPRAIPAETIVVQDARIAAGGAKPEDPAKRLESYVETNVELLKQTAQGTLPRSYIATEIPKTAHPKWLELDVLSATEYRGPVYTVRRYHLYNSKDATQSLRQTEFFTGEELSIAVDRHVIGHAQEASVFIATYTKPLPKDQRKAGSPDPEPSRRN
jgi:TraK protein